MKKATLALTALVCITVSVFIAIDKWGSERTSTNEYAYNAATLKAIYGGEEEEEKSIKDAKEYMNLVRQDPALGYVPVDAVIKARNQVKTTLNVQGNSAMKNGNLGIDWEEMGPDNIGGRTRAILIDRNNPQRMYCGGVSGGLFYSDNGGLQWQIHPWTLEQQHVGITAMVQDANGRILIATGEGFAPILDGVPNTFGAPGFIGSGIHRLSADGTSYEKLLGTEPSDTINANDQTWSFVYDVAVSPNNPNLIYAATRRGLQVSQDGGNSFLPADGVTPGLQNGPCLEVEVSPNGTVYASVNGRFYYRSADGLTFQEYAGQGGFPGQGDADFNGLIRVEYATTPDAPSYVYAMLCSNAGLTSILKSEDEGITWETLIRGNATSFNPVGQQAFWNIALGVAKGNPERLFIGGQLELWSLEDGGNRDLIAYWQPDSPTNPYYVHADMHVVAVHPTDPNIMYIGGDGGVYRTNNASEQFPEFIARNKGLNITQFYGMGTGFNGAIVGGTQDNGTNLNDGTNNTRTSYREVNGGDGGAAEISRINPNAMFATVYSGACRRSSNYGQSFGSFFDENIDGNSDGDPDGGALFLAPFILWEDKYDTLLVRSRTRTIEDRTDTSNIIVTTQTIEDTIAVPVEKSIFVLATGNGAWFTPDALNFSITPRWYRIATGSTTSEVTMSETGTLFHGNTNGQVWRTTGFADRYFLDSAFVDVVETISPSDSNIVFIDTLYTYDVEPDFGSASTVPSSILPRAQILNRGGGRFVTGIAVDPNNESNVVVTMGNYGQTEYVIRTADPTLGLSTSWEQMNNATLPEMPVYDVVIDYYNSNNIILATEFGIWACNNGNGPANLINWAAENAGTMTTVPTFKLRQDPIYDLDCRVLYAATHGRGIFRTTTLTPTTCDTEPFKEVVSVEETPIAVKPTAALSNLGVYPNPIDDIAYVEFTLAETSKLEIRVVDLMGRVVKEIPVGNAVKGDNKVQIDLGDLSKGVYVVAAIVPGNKALTKKVIVQ